MVRRSRTLPSELLRGVRVVTPPAAVVDHPDHDDVVKQVGAAAADDPESLATELRPVWRRHNTLVRDDPWLEEVAQ